MHDLNVYSTDRQTCKEHTVLLYVAPPMMNFQRTETIDADVAKWWFSRVHSIWR